MTQEELKELGFTGFETVKSLMNNECGNVENTKGVYVVLKNGTKKKFMNESIGGHFKGKNPTVDIGVLENKWIDQSDVLYIGQAGGGTSDATLKKRLKQYMKFGNSQPIGHWGGRYIWQLKENRDLIICWKALPNDDPREIEKEMIGSFENEFGKKPFANIVG